MKRYNKMEVYGEPTFSEKFGTFKNKLSVAVTRGKSVASKIKTGFENVSTKVNKFQKSKTTRNMLKGMRGFVNAQGYDKPKKKKKKNNSFGINPDLSMWEY
jgi:hypothetical protein